MQRKYSGESSGMRAYMVRHLARSTIDNDDTTQLTVATYHRQHEAVQCLLMKGANVDAKDSSGAIHRT
jgi:ankyrin repeat protein